MANKIRGQAAIFAIVGIFFAASIILVALLMNKSEPKIEQISSTGKCTNNDDCFFNKCWLNATKCVDGESNEKAICPYNNLNLEYLQTQINQNTLIELIDIILNAPDDKVIVVDCVCEKKYCKPVYSTAKKLKEELTVRINEIQENSFGL